MFKNNRFINSLFSEDATPFGRALPWIVAIFFHALGSFYSGGYHHPDEHYQIWEWANYFLGLTPGQADLRWEYTAEIRQWFQPLLHVGLMKFFLALKIYNPFTVALVARELYAGFNLLSLYALWKALNQPFSIPTLSGTFAKMNSQVCAWVIATLWFFPYIHARTSSENLSTIFITFAFAELIKLQTRKTVLHMEAGNALHFAAGSNWKFLLHFLGIGLLFGYAFVARYQVALGLVGFGIYLLWKERKITLSHLMLALGFFIAAASGVVMDRIGYGHWVFTPYSYFHVNLVQGVAATYNPYPWYQYFIWFAELNIFVTVPLFFGIYGYLKKIKMDALIAFIGSFFILHCFITNKEYRFLFPVFNFIPFMVAVGWNSFSPKSWMLFNIPGIVGSAFRTTSFTIWPLFAFHSYIDTSLEANQRWLSNHGQYDKPYYQLPAEFHYTHFNTIEDLVPAYEKTEKPLWILWDERPSNPPFEPVFNYLEARCERKNMSIPYFIFTMRERFPRIKEFPYQVVYYCERN